MIVIHAEGTRGGLAGALARGGLLVTADELEDIDRLTAWCVALRGSEPGRYPVRPYGDRRNQLAQLYADLVAGGPRPRPFIRVSSRRHSSNDDLFLAGSKPAPGDLRLKHPLERTGTRFDPG